MPIKLNTVPNLAANVIDLLVDYKGEQYKQSIPAHLFDTHESTRDALVDAIRLILNGAALVTHNKTVEVVAEIANQLAKDK